MEARGDASSSSAAAAGRAGDPLAPCGDPFALMAATDVVCRTAWRNNYADEFNVILDRVRRRLYVSLDLEFCGAANVDPLYWPQTPDEWYKFLCTFVNAGDVLQIGLALAFEQPPGAPPEPVMAWDINLRFDETSRAYHPGTIAFLIGQGHNLTRYKDEGVLPDLASAALLRRLPFGDPTVTWIGYHVDKDVAFILKLLQSSGLLPPERQDFLQLVSEKMPNLYDVKVLAQLAKPGYRGGLQKFASMIKVGRLGNAHQASSDALLAMACFSQICKMSSADPARVLCHHGLLSGLEQIHPAIINARSMNENGAQPPTVMAVTAWNFDEEARQISDLVKNNFCIMLLDVTLPGLSPPSLLASDAQKEYQLMKGALWQRDVDVAEIALGFANAEGLLALGRLWKFSIDLGDVTSAAAASGSATLQKFAPASKFWALMAACGGVHNPGTIWLTCHGGYGTLWMIKSLLSPLPLPEKWNDYVQIRQAIWPSLYDVGLIAHWCSEVNFRAPNCKGKLLDLARSLEVPVAEDLPNSSIDSVDRALLVFRCFSKLSALPNFNRVAKSVRSRAMTSCCWACSGLPAV